MALLPTQNNGKGTLVLRTDFSDDASWNLICEALGREDADGLLAHVRFLSDSAYESFTLEQIVAHAMPESIVMLVVDRVSMNNPEHPILVIDLWPEEDAEPGSPAKTFRMLPAVAASVQINLAMCNMDVADYMARVDSQGIFRGFS